MPNSGTEPHGKVTASATPFSRMSRTSGALDCTLEPPSCETNWAMVACAGRIFMPLMSPGTVIFFFTEWKVPGSWKKARQNLTSFISVAGILAVPGVDRLRSALGVGDQERQFTRADDREAARLVAWIDVGEVGDAVARHVVMVEGLAELLRRIDLELDGATGGLLDRRAPVFECLIAGDGTVEPSGPASDRMFCPEP